MPWFKRLFYSAKLDKSLISSSVLFIFVSLFLIADTSTQSFKAPLSRESFSSTSSFVSQSTYLSKTPFKHEQKDPLKEPSWSFFHPHWQNDFFNWSFFKSNSDTFDTLIDNPVVARGFIGDPDSRIEKEFKVPDSLIDRVSFWIDIYSKYSSRIRVVHDKNNLGIIYGFIDFRPIYRVSSSNAVAEARCKTIEKRILLELKEKIALAGGIKVSPLSASKEIDSIRSFLSKHGSLSSEALVTRIESIRTQSGQSDMFIAALGRAKNILPHIETVFRQYKLPVALARIPFVESSFENHALSKIGAVGIWQFTRETAKEMIHADDESHWADPVKQTKSAARLLRMYRVVLPEWGMVITAYNSGVGRIRRIVEKNKFRKTEDLINKTESEDSFGFAGRNFYSEFLAANIVEAYKEEIFSHLLSTSSYSLVIKEKSVLKEGLCEM